MMAEEIDGVGVVSSLSDVSASTVSDSSVVSFAPLSFAPTASVSTRMASSSAMRLGDNQSRQFVPDVFASEHHSATEQLIGAEILTESKLVIPMRKVSKSALKKVKYGLTLSSTERKDKSDERKDESKEDLETASIQTEEDADDSNEEDDYDLEPNLIRQVLALRSAEGGGRGMGISLGSAPTQADFARVPVTEFATALLRGMGWSKDQPSIGRRDEPVAEIYIPERRGKLVGLGAESAQMEAVLKTLGKKTKKKDKGSAKKGKRKKDSGRVAERRSSDALVPKRRARPTDSLFEKQRREYAKKSAATTKRITAKVSAKRSQSDFSGAKSDIYLNSLKGDDGRQPRHAKRDAYRGRHRREVGRHSRRTDCRPRDGRRKYSRSRSRSPHRNHHSAR